MEDRRSGAMLDGWMVALLVSKGGSYSLAFETRKVNAYASDETQLCKSAIAKLKEFRHAGYPIGVLQFMCNVLYTSTQKRTWRYLATTYLTTYIDGC